VDGSVAAGLRSRVRFSVQAPRPAGVEKAAAAPLEAVFEPAELELKEAKGGVAIWNLSQAPLTFVLRSVPFPSAAEHKGRVPSPSPDFLKVTPARLEVPARRSAAAALHLSLPKGDAHRGRRYVFLIRADSPDRPGAQPVFATVYAQAGQ
jgi:hypothetical protein